MLELSEIQMRVLWTCKGAYVLIINGKASLTPLCSEHAHCRESINAEGLIICPKINNFVCNANQTIRKNIILYGKKIYYLLWISLQFIKRSDIHPSR